MPVEQKTEFCIHIRWMIRRDATEVLEIESLSFEFPWSEDNLIRCLRQRDSIGMVGTYQDRVVGFMIYKLCKTNIHVLNFAVHPDYRRKKIGSQMVEKLINKLSAQRRSRLTLEVRESNLPAQIFFRNCGFRAVNILRNFYKDTPEDAYTMQLTL